ncbi:MAG TPA: hypothetical protein VHV81_13245 [Steroidobacteraceae bacterium]|jgi:hypothetical protein|nr:hypothetical protein [Steroidobacteraceae bacterium]
MINAVECFHYATLELVRSAPIKQRLVSAYRRHLAALPEEQLPSELRASFGQIMRALQGVQPMRGEDAVTASVRKMSNQEADECAAQIVEMFGQMCRFNVAAVRSNSVVQLHSIDRVADEYETAALLVNN